MVGPFLIAHFFPRNHVGWLMISTVQKAAAVCLNVDGAMENLKGTSVFQLQFQIGKKFKQ